MLDFNPQATTLYNRMMARRRTLMMLDSLPLAIVAAEVAAAWGVHVNEWDFFQHDVADVVASLDGLSKHEKAMLEWAILDNVNGYCAWTPASKQTVTTAARWPQQRPSYLKPERYKHPETARSAIPRT